MQLREAQENSLFFESLSLCSTANKNFSLMTFNLTDYNYNQFTVTLGKTYKAISTCGWCKDSEVIGALESVDLSTAILTNSKGQPFEVNAKTLKSIE